MVERSDRMWSTGEGIPGLGRFPGEGKGYPVQYSGLENSMDCTVVAKSRTQRSGLSFYFTLREGVGIPVNSPLYLKEAP